jgi:flagellar biosynthesis/type III secretory pathway protein FliH
MKLGHGRVLPSNPGQGEVVAVSGRHEPTGRVLRREILAAEGRARQLIAAAETRAAEIVQEGERAAASVRLSAEAEGRADAVAGVAARALALAQWEVNAVERQLDRIVQLARLLAERIVGRALELEPELVTGRAQELISAARGARRAVIVAHPDDCAVLERSLPLLGVGLESVSVMPSLARTRGSLRLETEVGVLDGDLALQLERLALKLRENLGP